MAMAGISELDGESGVDDLAEYLHRNESGPALLCTHEQARVDHIRGPPSYTHTWYTGKIVSPRSIYALLTPFRTGRPGAHPG